MSRLILHRAIGSPPARSVMMLAEILGLKLDIKDIDIVRMEQRKPEFLKMNPMGTVPVLEDGDFILSESHAILKYLLGKYGGSHAETLYPSDVTTRAIVDQTMFFNAGVFFPALTAVGRSAIMAGAVGPSKLETLAIDSAYRVVDAYLQNRSYIAADHMTIADLSVGSTATAMKGLHKPEPDRFPRYTEYMAKLEAEPLFKNVNAPGAEFFGKMFEAIWKRNKKKMSAS